MVSDDVRIPSEGVLGSKFLFDNFCRVDFGNKLLTINDAEELPFTQKFFNTRPGQRNLINFSKDEKLPFIDAFNMPSGKIARFLLDTGAEKSIIKKELVPEDADINGSNALLLTGIEGESVRTLGTVDLDIFGILHTTHVVTDDLPIPCMGIIGVDYLTQNKVIIDFGRNSMRVNEKYAPLKRMPREWRHYNDTEILKAYSHVGVQSVSVETVDGSINDDPGTGLLEVMRICDESGANDCETLEDIHSSHISNRETFEDLDINDERSEPLEDKVLGMFMINLGNETVPSTVAANESREERIKDLLQTDGLNQEELEQVNRLIKNHSDRIHLEGNELGATDVLEHRINTVDDNPIFTKQYRLPHHLKGEVDRQVKELLDQGIIKHSRSPYNSALWVVPKKPDADGKPRWRLVVDFRPLNKKTIGDGGVIPNITEILDQVGDADYFTILDCVSGFFQIRIHPRDTHKTAFTTPEGHFEFDRMAFGLKNTPPEYQRLMFEIFHGLIGKGLFIYIDDFVIYAKTLEEHERLFNEVMNRLRRAKLKLNPRKCLLLRREVLFLGHILSREGVRPDPKKIEAVKNFPVLKDMKNVRQFSGLVGYYRRFIKNFGKIAKPLTKLLQKEVSFVWDEAAQVAFDKLKEILCTAPLLQYPDFTKPFLINTDASGYALGAVLSQGEIGKDRPIAYASRV